MFIDFYFSMHGFFICAVRQFCCEALLPAAVEPAPHLRVEPVLSYDALALA
jgi:hypothetical protein